jgi:hypothetical protein
MPVETEFIAEPAYVSQAYIGPCGLEEYLIGTRTALELFERHANARWLVDLRQLENTARLTDLYELPEGFSAMKMPAHVKIALLAAPGHKDQDTIHFYETICVNRGWQVKTIYDREEGLRWLRE